MKKPPPDHDFETRFFESVHRRDPQFTDVIEILGGLYTRQGRVADGLKMDRKLVRLEPDDRVTRQLLEEEWGNSWGVLFKCDSSPQKLRRHLREFLLVRDLGGRRLVFRYYDPRCCGSI